MVCKLHPNKSLKTFGFTPGQITLTLCTSRVHCCCVLTCTCDPSAPSPGAFAVSVDGHRTVGCVAHSTSTSRMEGNRLTLCLPGPAPAMSKWPSCHLFGATVLHLRAFRWWRSCLQWPSHGVPGCHLRILSVERPGWAWRRTYSDREASASSHKLTVHVSTVCVPCSISQREHV